MSPEQSFPKEVLEQKPVDGLKLIIHPFFAPDKGGKKGAVHKVYRAARNKLSGYFEENYAPRQESDVTMIMPMLQEDSAAMVNPTFASLYKALKGKTQYPGNVFLTPDINLLTNRPVTVIETLKSGGFCVTEKTIVILGGEWIDACMINISKLLLTLSEFQRLRVDKRGILGSSIQVSDSKSARSKNIALYCANLPKIVADFGFETAVTQDSNFVYVEKIKRLTLLKS